jgi:hypothetical protein
MKLYFYIGQFVIAVVLVLLYYKFVEARSIKKYSKKNIPAELKLFIKTQHIDVKKINYKKLMTIVSIVNAINVGIVLLLTNLTSTYILKFIIAVPSMTLLLFMSYEIVGFVLRKKGMTKDEL